MYREVPEDLVINADSDSVLWRGDLRTRIFNMLQGVANAAALGSYFEFQRRDLLGM